MNFVYTGKRGYSFEELIDAVNLQYEASGLAVIEKVPTPIKVTKLGTDGKILEGFFEKKGLVDYVGTYNNGISIRFDAKSTQQKFFPLKNIHEHQFENLFKHHRMGGVCFLLVEFVKFQKIFLLPFQNLKYYWDRKEAGKMGTNSIPYEDFLKYGFEISQSQNYFLHYLKPVEVLIRLNKPNLNHN